METPLLRSQPFAARFGVKDVWLKMDCCQATGSFKDRAMLSLCQFHKDNGATRLVAASGGNAGVAAAYAAHLLGLPMRVFVPENTRPIFLARLRQYDAQISLVGETFNEAAAAAQQHLLTTDRAAAYMPPFDHPAIWRGNATIMAEIKAQLRGLVPDVIVVSVGGGGLVGGILLALRELGGDWGRVKVVCAETEGAGSMHEALKRGRLFTLPRVDTIAHSLGAKTVAQGVLDLALAHPGGVHSCLVSDAEALAGVEELLEEQRVLVEPACGATIAACYKLQQTLGLSREQAGGLRVVPIVCGGSGMNQEIFREMKELLRAKASQQPVYLPLNSAL